MREVQQDEQGEYESLKLKCKKSMKAYEAINRKLIQ